MKIQALLLVSLLCFCVQPSSAFSAEPLIVMETSKGTMTIELFDEKAPVTCENFRQYVQDEFYNGLIFHRIIPGFMIQGGGFESNLKQKRTRNAIFNEATNGLKNKRGTLSMARTPFINSATAQFFINVKNNRNLDHRGMTEEGYGYAVFGKIVEGMAVADAIVNVPRGIRSGMENVPNEDIVILKMYEKK